MDQKTKINEWCVQEAIYRNLNKKKHRLIVPNCKALGYEADVLSVSKAGFSYEFEVKLSRSDFRKDFTHKSGKHAIYQNGSPGYCPNHFFFVCPANIIEPESVPDYAGLLYILNLEMALFRVILDAPKIHNHKLSDRKIEWIIRSTQTKFWNDRTKYRLSR